MKEQDTKLYVCHDCNYGKADALEETDNGNINKGQCLCSGHGIMDDLLFFPRICFL